MHFDVLNKASRGKPIAFTDGFTAVRQSVVRTHVLNYRDKCSTNGAKEAYLKRWRYTGQPSVPNIYVTTHLSVRMMSGILVHCNGAKYLSVHI